MKNGTISVDILPVSGAMRELSNGQVLARPGQVYRIRIRNHAPRRAVADVSIDGKSVTEDGLVLSGYGALELERPTRDGETGCFTVVREGDEVVFGESGGRDNPELGLIVVSVRYEKERVAPRPLGQDSWPYRTPTIWPKPYPSYGPLRAYNAAPRFSVGEVTVGIQNVSLTPEPEPLGAAGTGLTGASNQRFVPVSVGELESEAIVIRLRLTIGRESDIVAARPLPFCNVPPRPAPQP